MDLLVFHVLKGDLAASQSVLDQAKAHAEDAVAQLVWPALVCAERLHQENQISLRSYKNALHILERLTLRALARTPQQADLGRTLFVCAVPGETHEASARLAADLAAQHGWRVQFAGAGLSSEELLFALGRLNPEVLLLTCDSPRHLRQAYQLIQRLHRLAIWPTVQIALTGVAVEIPDVIAQQVPADVVGRDPVEILELLQLCPEYRSPTAEVSPALEAGDPDLVPGSALYERLHRN